MNKRSLQLILYSICCILGFSSCVKRPSIKSRKEKVRVEEKQITRGLDAFREVAAEDKRYRADEYNPKALWYRGISLEDLKKGASQYETEGRLDLAVKYIDRIIKLSNDQDEIRQLRLKMADLLFDSREYERAAISYTLFAELYPGSDESEYAAYRAILSMSKLILEPDRDISAAQEVERLAREFLIQREEGLQTFTDEVRALLLKAVMTRYQHELLTFYFYFNNGAYFNDPLEYKAAQTRLQYIRERFLNPEDKYAYLPDIEADVTVLEYELAAALGDKAASEEKQKELIVGEQVTVAQQEEPIDFVKTF